MSMFTWVRDHGYMYGYNAMGMGVGTSPTYQEVAGTGPRPWVQVQTFVS